METLWHGLQVVLLLGGLVLALGLAVAVIMVYSLPMYLLFQTIEGPDDDEDAFIPPMMTAIAIALIGSVIEHNTFGTDWGTIVLVFIGPLIITGLLKLSPRFRYEEYRWRWD